MEPIKPIRRSWAHAALPLVVVATFAGIVVLITLFASHGPVTSGGMSSSSHGRNSDELVAQSTFHTGDLIVDNTSKFGGKMQIGAVAPGASQQAWFSLQSASTTTQLWIQEDDTGHTGSGGNNESINQVYRNFTGFAMGSGGTATAGAIDIHVNASKTSGSGTLETLAILSTAEGGDDNFDYLSLGGTMKHVAGPALFADTSTANLTTGGTLADLSASTAIKLNQNITSPKNAIPGDSTDTPQLAIGLAATANDGTGLQVKNTNGAQGLSGIDLLADTAVNGNQSTGVFMTRGNGGGGGAAGNNPAGIALIGNVGSIIANGSVGDMAVYNQVAGGRVIFGADAVHADYQMALDQTGKLTIGVTGTALTPVLELETAATAGTIPLNFSSAITNVWDISPATGSNTDPATITVFAQTPTTTPSVDQTLNMHLIAGTGGAGGVNLSPNGISFMDPDHWAANGTILAIGYLGTASSGEFEVHDQGNVHTTEHPEIKIVASSTYNTGSAALEAPGFEAICGATHGTGSGALTHTCGFFDAVTTNGSGGDITNALVTGQGDVILNRANGNTTIAHGTTTIASTGTLFQSQVASDFTSNSTYSAAFGNAGGIGQIYIVNGTIDAGWSETGVEHMELNFSGFHGGTGGATRDLNIRDGNANIVASFTGANKAFQSFGVITGVSYVVGGAFGPKWLSGSGDPEGNFTAGVGSIFSRTDGGSGTALYEKGTGAGNTGWSALSVGGGGSLTGSGSAGQSTRFVSATVLGNGAWTDDGTNATANGLLTASNGTKLGSGAVGGTLDDTGGFLLLEAAGHTTHVGGTMEVDGGTFSVTAGQIVASSWIAAGQQVYVGGAANPTIMLEQNASTSIGGDIAFAYGAASTATGYINSVGYQEGVTQFRDLEIDDGKGSGAGHQIVHMFGNGHIANFSGDVGIAGTLNGSAANFTGTLSGSAANFAFDVFVGGSLEVTSTGVFDGDITAQQDIHTDNNFTGGSLFLTNDITTGANTTLGTNGGTTLLTVNGRISLFGENIGDLYTNDTNFDCAYGTNAAATCKINAQGFVAGTTQFRSMEIDDGKGNSVALFDGPNSRVTVNGGGGLAVTSGVTTLGGHLRTTGTAITTGDLSCGAAPVVGTGSTDMAGTITVGAIGTTSCVLTFKATYTTAPFCVCSSDAVTSGGLFTGCATSATTLTASLAAGTAQQKFSYVCVGP